MTLFRVAKGFVAVDKVKCFGVLGFFFKKKKTIGVSQQAKPQVNLAVSVSLHCRDNEELPRLMCTTTALMW